MKMEHCFLKDMGYEKFEKVAIELEKDKLQGLDNGMAATKVKL